MYAVSGRTQLFTIGGRELKFSIIHHGNILENKMSKENDFQLPKKTYGDTLKFSPGAYAKLVWMRNRGNTEVAGFGITGTDDPLLVTGFRLIRSKCTYAHFDMDTNALADYQDLMLDEGIAIWQSARVLIHSHPGNSPQPSGNDEDNFRDAFSHPDWAIMFILADMGKSYCRLKINVGPGITKELKVVIDWSIPFEGSNHKSWQLEYDTNVIKTSKNSSKAVGDDKLFNEEYQEWTSDQRGYPYDDSDDFDCH